MFELIQRCMSLMIYMTEETMAKYLDKDGVDRGEAFLAIKAASMLVPGEDNDFRQK